MSGSDDAAITLPAEQTALGVALRHWLKEPSEHERLEFKEARAQFGFDELCRYAVAIANEGGGHLVLGVHDGAPRGQSASTPATRRIVGTRAFGDLGATAARVLDKLGFRVDLVALAEPEGRVVVCVIPPRPPGEPRAFNGQYLMRAGSALVPMSADRLRAIFTERDGAADPTLAVERSGLGDSEVFELLDVDAYFALAGLSIPAARADALAVLAERSLVRHEEGAWTITTLGALALARRLGDFDGTRFRGPRVVQYRGADKLDTVDDLVGSKGYAVGFAGLMDAIRARTPSSEEITGAFREERRVYPPVAIRELVANALIHQDFTLTGSRVMVEIYGDRVEISNPGLPVVSADRFIDEDFARNEHLADAMRRLRICERKGSGIDRVITAIEGAELPAPEFRIGERSTRAIVHSYRDFDQMDRSNRIRACYQHCSLCCVSGRSMTNLSLRKRFNLPDAKSAVASQVIAATLDAGLITLEDPTATSTRYRSYLPFWATTGSRSSLNANQIRRPGFA